MVSVIKFVIIGVSVAIYVLLLSLFLTLSEKGNSGYSQCKSYKPCVRFCCKSKSNCNDKFINDNFNNSRLPKYEDDEINVGFKSMFGAPNCSTGMISKGTDLDWRVTKVKQGQKILKLDQIKMITFNILSMDTSLLIKATSTWTTIAWSRRQA